MGLPQRYFCSEHAGLESELLTNGHYSFKNTGPRVSCVKHLDTGEQGK